MLHKFATKTLVAFCLVLTGCGGAMVKTSITTPDGHEWIQEISGKGKVVIEAAGMNFHGTLHVDPETGALDLELNSGQDAQGVQSNGMDLTTLVELMNLMKQP